MKWVARFKDKVSFSHSPSSAATSREQLHSPNSDFSTRSRNKHESELDFKRFWEEFRSSNSEKEKEEALEMAVDVFCRLTRRTGSPSQLVNMLVDAHVFSFVVARALVTDTEKLKSSSGSLDAEDIIHFFGRSEKDDVSVGANMLFALEGLVSPPLDLQPLLDAGLLSCLVFILHSLLGLSGSGVGMPLIFQGRLEGFQDGASEQAQRPLVEGSIIHIMKALARHPGATHCLAEDDSLKLLFNMVALDCYNQSTSENPDTIKSILHLAQLQRQVMQILGLLLVSDKGSMAQYIHKHQLIKILLRVIKDFDGRSGDAAYAVGVVDLLLECIELSCRSESGGVRLREDLRNAHGYQFLVQFTLKLAGSYLNRRELQPCNEPGGENVNMASDITQSSLARISNEGSIHESRSNFPPVLTRLLDILVNLAQVGVPEPAGAGKSGKAGITKLNASRSLFFSDSGSSNDHSGTNGKVRDMDAVQVLQDIFLKAENLELQLEVVDRLLRIFASHPENYGLCQNLRTISLFILNMGTYSEVLQERLLKILEYAVTVVNCVPEQELLSLCCLLQQPLAPSMKCNILSFFVKLLSFDKQYKKVFREVGVLELLIDDLKHLGTATVSEPENSLAQNAKGITSLPSPKTEESREIGSLSLSVVGPKPRIFEEENTVAVAWDCLASMIKNSEGNQSAFRKANGVAAVLPLLTCSSHHADVLRLLYCLISEDTNQSHPEELGALIEVAKSGVVTNISGRQFRVGGELRRDILWAIHRILGANNASKDVFGAATGFSLLFTLLHSFQIGPEVVEGSSSNLVNKSPPQHLHMEIFSALLHVVTSAVSDNFANRGRLHKVISTDTFKELLCESGLLCVEYEADVGDLILNLALEKVHLLSTWKSMQSGVQLVHTQQTSGSGKFREEGIKGILISGSEDFTERNDDIIAEDIINSGAIEVLMSCLQHFSFKMQLKVLKVIEKLAHANAHNQDCLTAVGCISLLLDLVQPVSKNPSQILPHVLKIVEILGSYRLSSSELRTLARYIWQSRNSSAGETGQRFIESIERMIRMEHATPANHSLAPFVEFSMNKSGYSCMFISLGDRTWPPATGYSFSFWFRYKDSAKWVHQDQPINQIPKKEPANRRRSIPVRQHAKIHLFSVGAADEESTIYAELNMDDTGILTLATSSSSCLPFKGVYLDEGIWHHVVVVHSKPNALAGLFQSSIAYLFVNGRLRQTGKLGYSASPLGKALQATIGTPPSEAEVRLLSWQLGSCYLFEEVLTAPAVCLMYALGRGYHGLFQDTDLLHFLPYEACGGGNLGTLEALEIESALGNSAHKGDAGIKGNANKTDGSGVVWDLDKLANFCGQISSKKLIFAFNGTQADPSISSIALSLINLVDPMSSAASPLGGLPRLARLHGDIHVCSPCSLGENMRKVGGVAVVLALVEAAESKEMLHLALSLLACILSWSQSNSHDMQAIRGYHLLALFLHCHMSLFEMRDLDVLFQITACEASCLSSCSISQSDRIRSTAISGSLLVENNLESMAAAKVRDDHTSPFSSQIDAVDLLSQQEVFSHVSELESIELPEVSNSLVLANPEMMEHVLLDWTLWATSPVSIQLAQLGFIERLVSMHRYRNHNLTMLRRINIVQHLLVTLQRGDVEIPVLEKLVVLLGIILEDGFLQSELKYVVDFVVMTFDPPEVIQRSAIEREAMGMQVIVRNMLLEMLIDLQVTISVEEVLETWHKTVSSKIITFLLDEAVHPTSMRWVMTLLGVCLASSPTFGAKFRNSGGYQGLVQVLPSFYDCPEVYYILFCLLFGKSVYPRQPEVRMLDFHALMPNDGSSGELFFTDLLDAIVAMSKAAFDRLTMQAQLAEQTGDYTQINTSLAATFREDVMDSMEELQGEALLHKTYAARLLSGEAAAPGLVTSILRFMVDLAKMCRPFSTAFRHQDYLESCCDLYFSCMRSAHAIQLARRSSDTQSLQSRADSGDAMISHICLPGGIHTNEQLKNGGSKSVSIATETVFKNNGNDVVSISRSMPGHKVKDASIASGMEEDTLSSEGIICDVNLFKLDSLDHLISLAGSSPPMSMKKSDEIALHISSSPSNADTDSSGSPFVPAVGSPFSSDVSNLGTGSKAVHSGSMTPVGASSTWLGTSSQSDVQMFQTVSSFATSTSDIEPALYGKFSGPGILSGGFCDDVQPDLLLKLDSVGAGGGPYSTGAAAALDLIAEVLADALTEQFKSTSLIEVVLEAAPLYISADSALVFQGLCLVRLLNFLERRLLRDDEERAKKLDKNRWSSNLELFSWLLVDRVYMGAFADPGAAMKVLEFLLSMLQLANKDRRVEEATSSSKGLLSLTRGGNRQVETYVQALLKNTNRMIMYCFMPSFLSSIGEDAGTEGSNDVDGGLTSSMIDMCTVMQLIIANKELILCSINMDADLVCCLCVNTISMLWDCQPTVRNLAVEIMKSLLVYRRASLEELLIVRPSQGEALDVLHDGFDKLLSSNMAGFYNWLQYSREVISKVLDQCASIMWMQFVSGSTKFPGVRVKLTESRRKREMMRRIRESTKADIRHWEQMSERRYALDVVREAMATELRAIRQDKYGWVLHAESEWQGHLQQLVHERGIWPMLKPVVSSEPEWQLCATEGPYRMRKKLEWCKRKVDIVSNKLKYNLEDSEGDRVPVEKSGIGFNITDPDYDSFFHLFAVGTASHNTANDSSKDFMEVFEDDDDAFKGTEEDGDSSSAKVGLSDDQWNNYKEVPTNVSQQAPPRAKKVRSTQMSAAGDVPVSVVSSPKDHLRPANEDLKNEDRKSERDVNDDGEYLIRPYLEPGEKIRFRYNCERVVGLEKHDGIFLIGEICLYVIENYYIDESGRISEKVWENGISVIDQALGVKCTSSGMANLEDMKSWDETGGTWLGGRAWAYTGNAWGKDKVYATGNMPHLWRMWKLDSVHELLKRRYQLRPVAVEIFSMDGCNDLLVFHKNERDEVFKNLLSMSLPRNSIRMDTTISGSSKQETNEGGRLFKMMAKSFSKCWQNGEISNFQYLMHLNTLAGRGYNDLTQYPVFPWILRDYESEDLDLNDHNSFRCLDKPMGALTPEREEEFRRRYESWDDPEIPRFHYGSHYSSAGIVLFYLIRLPPFSEENKKLQGGQFDHADRLFNSIRDTWLSASQGNTADVKELIPEFFYMPEFLENRFNLKLGVKQCGEQVDDVLLPPWAKGSAQEFIRKHREALESQYVSENLHHWIDLIFGYRQRGKAAVDATNVFFYLTYEGAVDIDSIEDPAMKASILAQINHFGQTPRQLFLKPHPKRKCHERPPPVHALRHHNLLVPREVRTISSPISQIVIFHDKIHVCGSNHILKPRSYTKCIAWGFPDRSLRFMSYDQDRLISTHEGLHGGGQIQCAGISRDGRILVTGGEDGVVAIWRLRKDGIRKQRRLHLQKLLCAHTQKVTCVAVCQPYSLVVSGSNDHSVIFWDLRSLEFVLQLPEMSAPISAVHANDLTGRVVTAAGTNLTVWTINGECLATVNTSQLPSDTIMSVISSLFSDWMETNWFITGHQSGGVKLWHMEHISDDVTRLRVRSHSVFSVSEYKRLKEDKPSLPSQKSLKKDGHLPGRFPVSSTEYQLILFRVLKWHKQPVTSIYLTNDLKQLVSGDAGGHLVSWALPDETFKSSPLQEN